MDKDINEKYENLKSYIKKLKKTVLAFSGGVDSTFLLMIAKEVLKENVAAIIVSSASYPKRELDEAVSFCKDNNIKYEVIKINELEIKGFKENPKNRCYICKHYLFSEIKKAAKKYGTDNVMEGSNIDDIGDWRPGRVAINELNILSPLEKCGLTKEEIRVLSKEKNLKTWNKPSFACLSSRFPYGEEISEEKLKMVEEAEQLLYELGFSQFRVRIHKNIARIEINEDEFEKIISKQIRTKILDNFKLIGFKYVALDLKGYRTGSLNEVL